MAGVHGRCAALERVAGQCLGWSNLGLPPGLPIGPLVTRAQTDSHWLARASFLIFRNFQRQLLSHC